ncbi:MAG: replication initiation protein [Clostridia bacterium]|nr:replication initiation protein [Clostridia bacterium]
MKKVLQSLRDKSMWITNADGSESTVAWLSSVTMSKKNGTVICKIDPKMAPYLYDLRDRFTQYDLFEILAMKSTYSIRIFELLRSYAWQKKVQFQIDDFRRLLMIDNIKSYTNNFKALREKVIEPAIKEINEYTFLHVEYSTKVQNRKVTDLIFTISEKPDVNRKDPNNSRLVTISRVNMQLDGE